MKVGDWTFTQQTDASKLGREFVARGRAKKAQQAEDRTGAPRSIGPGTPAVQQKHLLCSHNHFHPLLMLGRVCVCGYEGRA